MANVLHFHVPLSVVGDVEADPITSGGYPSSIPRDIALKMGFLPKQGEGEKYVCLCNPKQTLTEVHGATGEPWAVTCLDCMQKDYFKEQLELRPHPKVVAELRRLKEIQDGGCCG